MVNRRTFIAVPTKPQQPFGRTSLSTLKVPGAEFRPRRPRELSFLENFGLRMELREKGEEERRGRVKYGVTRPRHKPPHEQGHLIFNSFSSRLLKSSAEPTVFSFTHLIPQHSVETEEGMEFCRGPMACD